MCYRHGNEICVDTARKICITAEHWEMLFSIAEKIDDLLSRVFKPAMMQRANVEFDRPILEAYYSAFMNQGIVPEELHLIPEDDSWIYPTLKDGVAFDSDVSICNVFTCKVRYFESHPNASVCIFTLGFESCWGLWGYGGQVSLR